MMRSVIRNVGRLAGLAAVLAGLSGCLSTREAATFATPEAAVQALAEVAASGDEGNAASIFGRSGVKAIRSGDPVADREDGERVREMIREKIAFEDAGNGAKTILIGNDAWPFPYPLVQVDEGWTFDLAAGEEELMNRRVGRNELLTLATLHAYVDAQREYQSVGRDGKPAAYARKVVSSEGSQDGLWWPVPEGQAESPLGPLFAAASSEGYGETKGKGEAYHGYRFRILTGQGRNAPGGERSYVDAQGLMTGGFAAVAWPARYGNSGIMTFVVNQQGIIFQKDLGEATDGLAKDITTFDPDSTWEPAED